MMKRVFILALMTKYVKSHSWVSCTDYDTSDAIYAVFYNNEKCTGWPRCSENAFQDIQLSGFGADSNLQFARSQDTCQCPIDSPDNIYTVNTPMAKYDQKQTVCLAYAAKNHVADTCVNDGFIPDGGVVITRSSQPNDDIFDVNYQHCNGIHVFGEVDYKGFQNCPNFCDDPDGALCTICFDLEDNIQPGEYSFKWTWEFNIDEFYSTCWDAEILAASGNTTVAPTVVPTPSVTPIDEGNSPCTITIPPFPTPAPTPNSTPTTPLTPVPTTSAPPVTPVPTTPAPPVPTTSAPPVTPVPTTEIPVTHSPCTITIPPFPAPQPTPAVTSFPSPTPAVTQVNTSTEIPTLPPTSPPCIILPQNITVYIPVTVPHDTDVTNMTTEEIIAEFVCAADP